MNITTEDHLKQLGLTHQEIQVYLALNNQKALRAKEIATKVSILPHAVYRTVRQLAKKGFVRTLKTYPVTFQAIPPQTAIPLFVEEQVQTLQRVTASITDQSPALHHDSSPTAIDLIYGSNTIFEQAARLLNQAKQEMIVISIGEPIPPTLLLSVKNAVGRGVSIKMIVHKYDESNKIVVENLKKNGYTIRYSPGWGFHIAVYDKEKSP